MPAGLVPLRPLPGAWMAVSLPVSSRAGPPRVSVSCSHEDPHLSSLWPHGVLNDPISNAVTPPNGAPGGGASMWGRVQPPAVTLHGSQAEHGLGAASDQDQRV